MLYIEQSLSPNEELIHVGQFHWMYTVHAFFSIIFGILMSILIIAGGTYINIQLGKFPPGIGWFEGMPYLHPGLRIFSFLTFLFGVLGFAQKMIFKSTTEMAVTNRRLVFKQGLIARQVGEISIDRVEGVAVAQTLLGRMFDYGRLQVRGMGVGEVVMPPIQAPLKFRQAIEKAKLSVKGEI